MYRKMLLGLMLFGLLTVIFAACSIKNASTSSIPAVHMGATTFLQSSVTIKKGDMLNLIDDANSEHIITNGSWINGQQVPRKEPGAPTVNQVYAGNDQAAIGPFNTAGTYHLYCTIHVNMNLAVIVQ
jgi:plastocyanin